MKGFMKMIEDPEDMSQLYKLPQHYKDLAQIIHIDCKFSLDENNVDHQVFIDRYKDIIGVEIKHLIITERKGKDTAIKYICYRQAIYCYEHLIKHKPQNKLDEHQQNEYELLVQRENQIALEIHNIHDLDDLNEELRKTRDIMMPYFISYSNNKFIDPGKAYYPR